MAYRLLVHVEGQTEETFVNDLLREHLLAQGYHSVAAQILGNARHRSGICSWPLARTDIMNHLKEDQDCIATTMVDYYGMPQTRGKEWPGRKRSTGMRTTERKAQCVQEAMRDDLVRKMGRRFNARRFVPFVVMHEFEGLLFSDCAAFSRGIARPDLESNFRKIRDQFATPEDINDSPVTAPSKRIEALVHGYQKPLLGVLAALAIGLSRIRLECHHFDAWLNELESLVSREVAVT